MSLSQGCQSRVIVPRRPRRERFRPGPDDFAPAPAGLAGPGRLTEVACGRALFDLHAQKQPGQSWAAFAVWMIRRSCRRGCQIHFDLTNVADIEEILPTLGPWACAVTSIELRFLRGSWGECGRLVSFWDQVAIRRRGVTGIRVPPPWPDSTDTSVTDGSPGLKAQSASGAAVVEQPRVEVEP